MRLLLLLLSSGLSQPMERALMPEERWRVSKGKDLDKYELAPQINTKNFTWEDKPQRKTDVSYSNRKDLDRPKVACGVEGPLEERIVGGTEAAPHQWPWMAAIYVNGYLFCGGTFISQHYVLTAAHCVDGGYYFDILAGAHNVKSGYEDNRVEISSFNGWTHPDWEPATVQNDLALIELPEPLPLSQYISLACLPHAGEVVNPGTPTSITGWGKIYDGSSAISPTLQMVHNLPTISNEDCNSVYEGIAGTGVVCVDTTGGHGSCHGDSGGPLITKARQRGERGQVWTQVGIVSFGSGECEGGQPAGFTRTEHYLDWISAETGLDLG